MSRLGLAVSVAAILLPLAAVFVYLRRQGHANPAAVIRSSVPFFPTGLALDGSGNIYAVAHKQNRILEITPSGEVIVFAGNGHSGFSGDGGAASQATLNAPVGITLDSLGNLFIADTNNNRIRRVDAKTHIITTVAGNGFLGGGSGAAATAQALYQPVSVAVDGNGDLYIGQMSGVGIARVDAITHLTSAVLGAGLPGDTAASAPASGPFWIAMDGDGTLYYADPSRNSVSQVSLPENSVQTIAGNPVCGFDGDGRPAAGALLCFPEALSVRSGKEIFIADTGNNRIRRVDLETGSITTVAGNGKAAFSGDGGPAVDASLNGPMGLAVDGGGDVYIADTGNQRIRLLHAKSGVITTWAIGEAANRPSQGAEE